MANLNLSVLNLYTKGTPIWAWHPEAQCWIPAKVTGSEHSDHSGQSNWRLSYQDESGKEYKVDLKDPIHSPTTADTTLPPPLRNPASQDGLDDLTQLSYLHEPGVLFNIETRYKQQSIYTYSGIVLIAVNPFERLSIYSPEVIRSYAGRSRSELEPHLFAIAESALRSMVQSIQGVSHAESNESESPRSSRNQSIIISGESGAGKTVSAKYIMRYLATADKLDDRMSLIEEKLLATNPILESFGNARTIRNDNSSRFGKYIQILFSRKTSDTTPSRGYETTATIVGARLRTYLLEKSRIVHHAKNERNYHIFYQLLAGLTAEERLAFELSSPDWRDYYYLNQGGRAGGGEKVDDSTHVDMSQEAEDFRSMKKALLLVGLSDESQGHVFRLLAAILHLGNIDIQGSPETSSVDMTQPALLSYCRLVGIPCASFVEWLTMRKIVTRHETILKEVGRVSAIAIRDSIAKALYAAVFDWLVEQMNLTLSVKMDASHCWIGILDIYGFEHFTKNSFEQFCINYANEKLQQEFNRHVFRLEQELYADEGIQWSYIDYHDNKTTIEMIENKLGILDLLDEETRLAHATDATFIQKLSEHVGRHQKYQNYFCLPKRSIDSFLIHHFAYSVTYDGNGFLEKNREALPEEQLLLFASSSDSFLAHLFPKESTSMPKKSSSATLGSHFKHSLGQLMSLIAETQVHYIRCIKPSETKRAFHFDPSHVLSQLRSCGVLETIRISCAGYPARYNFDEFTERYYMLAPSVHYKESGRQLSELILKHVGFPSEQYQMGRTRLFFRAGQIAHIERLCKEMIEQSATRLQKWARGHWHRKVYKERQQFILAITTLGRGYVSQQRLFRLIQERLANMLQSLIRKRDMVLEFEKMKSMTVFIQAVLKQRIVLKTCQLSAQAKFSFRIQTFVRQQLARHRYSTTRSRLVLLQCCYRGRIGRQRLQTYRSEARSVTRLQEQSFQLENTVLSMRRALEEKETQIKSIQQLEASLTESQALYEELRGRHADLLGSFDIMKDKLSELESALGHEKKSVEMIQEQHRSLEVQNLHLKSENDRLTKLLAEASSEQKETMSCVPSSSHPLVSVTSESASVQSSPIEPAMNMHSRPRRVRKSSETRIVDSTLLSSLASPESKLAPMNISEHEAEILLQDTSVENELLENLLLNLKIPSFDGSDATVKKQEVLFPVHLIHFRAALLWSNGLLDRLSSLVLKTTSAADRLTKAHHDGNRSHFVDDCLFWISFLREFHTLLENTFNSVTHRPFSAATSVSPSNTSYSESFLIRFRDYVLEGIEETIQQIYQTWSRETRRILDRLAIPALLDTQGLPGYTAPNWTSSKWFSGMFSGAAQSMTSINGQMGDASAAMEDFLDVLDRIYNALVFYYFSPRLMDEILEAVVSHALRTVFNQLLLRSKGYICWKRGMQIQYNLTRLEEWASSAELSISLSGSGIGKPSGLSILKQVTESFERLLQATKLMQLSKNQEDAASLDLLLEVCWLLTPPQILKILSLYRPIGMEDPVAPGLLSGIAARVVHWKSKLKSRQEGDALEHEPPLLLDTVSLPCLSSLESQVLRIES